VFEAEVFTGQMPFLSPPNNIKAKQLVKSTLSQTMHYEMMMMMD